MCDECGKVCWQLEGFEMTPEEQEELERHIAKLIEEAKRNET